jgi:response regulator of citrate/malate metabolism
LGVHNNALKNNAMKISKPGIPKFRIAILEDNLYYNKLMKNQISCYFEDFGMYNHCSVTVKSFVNTSDFVSNLSINTDVVLLDFYLQDGENALGVMDKIKTANEKCKILIISGSQNLDTYYKTFWKGAADFIMKDKFAALNVCRIIEAICTEKMTKKS